MGWGRQRSQRLLLATAAGIALLLFIETRPIATPGDVGSRMGVGTGLPHPHTDSVTDGHPADGEAGQRTGVEARAEAASDAGAPSWDTAVGRPGGNGGPPPS